MPDISIANRNTAGLAAGGTDSVRTRDFRLRLPRDTGDVAQDEEWFLLETPGRTRRLRIHDYAQVYGVPGLYEALVHETLQCRSPERVARLFGIVLEDAGEDPRALRALDLGAGNGLVGAQLRALGIGRIIGLDLLPEARRALERDRPEVYDDYLVGDLCALDRADHRTLANAGITALVAVGALGFGAIAPQAFVRALAYLRTGGWLAMTIKEDFIRGADATGFAALIHRFIDTGILELAAYQHYRHRVSIAGEDLYYVALVARKRRDPSEAESDRASRPRIDEASPTPTALAGLRQ